MVNLVNFKTTMHIGLSSKMSQNYPSMESMLTLMDTSKCHSVQKPDGAALTSFHHCSIVSQ